MIEGILFFPPRSCLCRVLAAAQGHPRTDACACSPAMHCTIASCRSDRAPTAVARNGYAPCASRSGSPRRRLIGSLAPHDDQSCQHGRESLSKLPRKYTHDDDGDSDGQSCTAWPHAAGGPAATPDSGTATCSNGSDGRRCARSVSGSSGGTVANHILREQRQRGPEATLRECEDTHDGGALHDRVLQRR